MHVGVKIVLFVSERWELQEVMKSKYNILGG